MVVRICLLVLLAVAMATGCTSPGEVTEDHQAELAELGDAVLVRAIDVPAPRVSLSPIFVRGNEVVPSMPFPGRLFRPPRVAFA